MQKQLEPAGVPPSTPVLPPRSRPLFNGVVALTEIGVAREIAQQKDTAPDIGPRTVGPSPQNYDRVPAWLYAGIIGASGAAASIIVRGAKGGAFQTASKYGWGVQGRGPLWHVSVQVAAQVLQGYHAEGNNVVLDLTERLGHGRAPYGTGGK